MARFKRITVNVPADLEEVLAARVAEAGYSSDSAYFLGLFLFDAKSRRHHRWTAQLLSQPPRVRDAAFAQLAADFKAGKGSDNPGWFEHRLRELVEQEIQKAKPRS